MQLKQRFVVAYPRAVVWDFFGRMEDVTPCMPGASLAEAPSEKQAKFKLNVKLGPISAAFIGDADLERDAANCKGTIRGNARDTKGDSRVKGVVDYVLTPEQDGHATAVDIDVEFALTGRLAQFSRGGVVNDLASRLTQQFAANLENALTASQAQTSVASAQAGPAEAAAMASPIATSAGTRVDNADAKRASTSTPPASGTAGPTTTATQRPAELKAGRLLFSILWDRIKAFFASFARR